MMCTASERSWRAGALLGAAALLSAVAGCGLLSTQCGTGLAVDDNWAPDTGSGDAGHDDAAAVDLDAQLVDGAAPDSFVPDTPGSDARTPDAVAPDSNAPDSNASDGQTPDGQTPDGQTPDGQTPDGQTPDGQTPDGQTPDGQTPDGHLPDAVAVDATIMDSAAFDDGLPASSCGTVSVYQDSFNDNSLASFWEVNSNGPTDVVEQNQQLEVVFDRDWEDVYTEHLTSLAGDRLVVQLAVPTAPGSNAEVSLTFFRDDWNTVTFTQQGGLLSAEVEEGGELVQLREDAFLTAEHRWLAISESQGTLSFETSSNGSSWLPFASTTTPAFVRRGLISLGGGNWNMSSPSPAAFDNLNTDRQQVGWCLAEVLEDDFEDGVIDLAWDPDSVSRWCSAEARDGALHMETTDSVNCNLLTSQPYQLDGSTAAVAVSSPALEAGETFVGFELYGADNDFYIHLSYVGGEVETWERWTNSWQSEPVGQPRWLRIGVAGSSITLEYADDSGTWYSLDTVDLPQPPGPVYIGLNLDTSDEGYGSAAQSASFDDYNLEP